MWRTDVPTLHSDPFKWLCESGLTCLLCKRIESDPNLIHHWSSSRPGLGRWIMMCNLEICLRSCGPVILFRARLTNQYEMDCWNVNWNDWNHIGPGRELSATCEDHLWAHGGSKYFVREPPLEPSSQYSWSWLVRSYLVYIELGRLPLNSPRILWLMLLHDIWSWMCRDCFLIGL